MATPLPCPKCGLPVTVLPMSGGRGTGELTDYGVHCVCGLEVCGLSKDGTTRSAISDWNRYVSSSDYTRHTPAQHAAIKAINLGAVCRSADVPAQVGATQADAEALQLQHTRSVADGRLSIQFGPWRATVRCRDPRAKYAQRVHTLRQLVERARNDTLAALRDAQRGWTMLVLIRKKWFDAEDRCEQLQAHVAQLQTALAAAHVPTPVRPVPDPTRRATSTHGCEHTGNPRIYLGRCERCGTLVGATECRASWDEAQVLNADNPELIWGAPLWTAGQHGWCGNCGLPWYVTINEHNHAELSFDVQSRGPSAAGGPDDAA